MDIKETNVCAFTNRLLDESWKYAIPFVVKGRENKKSLPIWSFIEQIGVAIKHSTNPNFAMVTFQYSDLKRIYSVIYPIVGLVGYNEEVTRDYHFFEKFDYEQIKLNAIAQEEYLTRLKSLANPSPSSRLSIIALAKWTIEDEIELLKETLLIPWQVDNLKNHYELNTLINFQQNEPTVIEFFEKRGFAEPYSIMRCEPKDLKSAIAEKILVKVYCEDKQVMSYLNSPRFAFVNDKGMADIWWFKEDFFEFAKLAKQYPNTLVNHFPMG